MNANQSLNIIFAGTPEFSVYALQALLQSKHKVVAIYTQPDRPAGRGRKLTPSPVKAVALAHQIPVYQPLTLRDEAEQQKLKALNADLMVVVAYGLLLPKAVLEAPRLGCINIHASLLPRFRGAAPIQRAILANDEKTGITIMQMDVGLDTGPMLYKTECPILATDTSETLHDRLAVMGADALLATLNTLSDLIPDIQDGEFATYANKITKEEAHIDWRQPASEIALKIRAFNPWPVAFTGQNVRIWEAVVVEKNVENQCPGTILQTSTDGIDVATGQFVLRLLKIQLPGGRVLPVRDILNSRQRDFSVGTLLS